MHALQFTPFHNRPGRLLCLGAHCDDVEIGCGASLLSMLAADSNWDVTWVIFSAGGSRGEEARTSAEAYLEAARGRTIILESFPDGFFPYRGEEIKRRFESLKSELNPDIVFTHYRNDAHQDHRVVSELTWNTFRDHTILEYEIPKYDGDLGRPNVYIPVDAVSCKRKIALLMKHYASQRNKHWFTEETFMSMLRLRGIESRSPTGYAEAFHCPKLVLRPTSLA